MVDNVVTVTGFVWSLQTAHAVAERKKRSYGVPPGPLVHLRNEGQTGASVENGRRWFIFTITANFGYGPYKLG